MNKVKNQLLLNMFVIIAAIAFAGVLIFGNVGRVAANVAVIPGSYGEEYANKNNLNIIELADSEKEYFDLRYETFDYSVENGVIVVEGYTGTSSDLVIPALIHGSTVTTIGKDFTGNIPQVKNLFIPPTVSEIQADVDESIIIHCYEDTPVYKKFQLDNEAKEKEAEQAKEAETGIEGTEQELVEQAEETEEVKTWNYEVMHDSDFVDFSLGDNPFAYNLNGATIEITRYTGDEDLIVIPSYINGYPVTEVSMNLLGSAKGIVIPETVTSITGTSSKLLYTPLFAIELLFSLIAIVFSLLTVNVLLPRYRKDNTEYLLTGSQMVSVVLYVLAQIGFAIAAIYYISITPFMALVISLVIMAVFVLFVFSAGIGRQHVKEVTQRNIEKTSRMDAIKLSAKRLSELPISDQAVKKHVQRLVEEIRYSDPVSKQGLDNIESELEKSIDDLKVVIDEGDSSEILKQVDETMGILQKRNSMCKAEK